MVASEKYIKKKIKEWNQAERAEFVAGLYNGDWEKVYEMTKDLGDLGFCQALQSNIRFSLYHRLKATPETEDEEQSVYDMNSRIGHKVYNKRKEELP